MENCTNSHCHYPQYKNAQTQIYHTWMLSEHKNKSLIISRAVKLSLRKTGMKIFKKLPKLVNTQLRSRNIYYVYMEPLKRWQSHHCLSLNRPHLHLLPSSFSNNPSTTFSISAFFCLFRNKWRKGPQKHRCFSAESPLCNCCPFYYSVGSELQGFLPTALLTALCATERKEVKEAMGEVGSRKKNSREVWSLKF